MSLHQWQRMLLHRLRRWPYYKDRPDPTKPTFKRVPVLPSSVVTVVVGILLAMGIIGALEAKLRPVIATVAGAKTQNTITAVLEHAVMDDLGERGLSYGDLVTIERGESGNIAAMTTDMAQMNRLRAQLVSQILTALDSVAVTTIEIPLGSLIDSELMWARGPSLRARVMSIGAVTAEFESEFSSAGVNQTLHRIWLELSVPMTVLLPGRNLEVPVHTRLCIAETVIVGQVPNTYLQFGNVPASG